MSEQKHTQGEWSVGSGTFTDLVIKSDARTRPIALIGMNGDAEEEAEDRANAALLAAAKEMYAALQAMDAESIHAKWCEYQKRCDAGSDRSGDGKLCDCPLKTARAALAQVERGLEAK